MLDEVIKTLTGFVPLSYFTVFIALVSFFFAHRSFIKHGKFQSRPLILTVIGLFLILYSIYLNGRFVQYDELGTPAQFGQFGDFIGGLLNPMLGFITVILLVESYKITLDTNHTTQNTYQTTKAAYNLACNDSAREARKTEREEIKVMILEFDELLTSQKAIERFGAPTGLHGGAYYQSLDKILKQGGNATRWLNSMVQKLEKDPNHAHTLENPINKYTFLWLSEIRSTVESITELYLNLIDKQQSDTVNKFNAIKLDQFLILQLNNSLITINEYHKILDSISLKLESEIPGFSRKKTKPQVIPNTADSDQPSSIENESSDPSAEP